MLIKDNAECLVLNMTSDVVSSVPLHACRICMCTSQIMHRLCTVQAADFFADSFMLKTLCNELAAQLLHQEPYSAAKRSSAELADHDEPAAKRRRKTLSRIAVKLAWDMTDYYHHKRLHNEAHSAAGGSSGELSDDEPANKRRRIAANSGSAVIATASSHMRYDRAVAVRILLPILLHMF
jgi:hypothetical protein